MSLHLSKSGIVGNHVSRLICSATETSKNLENLDVASVAISWMKVFRIIPEFRILRLTFHRKSASKC